MSPVANGIVLAMILVLTGSEERRHARALETGPVNIEVAYTENGNLYYYSLNTRSFQSQFSLHYYEYLRRPQAKEERMRSVVFNLPGWAGRQLTMAFKGLELPWNPRDYHWLHVPDEHFAALPEDRVPCGMLAFGAQQVLACAVSAWASANKSAPANNLAWFIQMLELSRYRFAESERTAPAEQSKDTLLRLLQRIDGGDEVEAARSGPGADRRIPVGLMLRTTVAEALVHGGLVGEPMSRPEAEIRRAAVEWYADRLPQEDARRALLQALHDADSSVRAGAAIALATEVGPDDRTTIEAIREVLAREPDPVVRQVIQDLLEGPTTQGGGNGSP